MKRRSSVVLLAALALALSGCGDDADALLEQRARERAADTERHEKEMARIDADAKDRRERLAALRAKRAAAKTEEEKRKVQEEIDALSGDAGISPVPHPRPTAPALPVPCTCKATDPLCDCL